MIAAGVNGRILKVIDWAVTVIRLIVIVLGVFVTAPSQT
jgi:phage shock protein PspC (stress-responsive transcriptional regulator)